MPDMSNKSADNLMKDFEKLKSEQMAFFNNISKVKPLTLDSILNTPAPNGSSVAGDSESFRLQLKKIEADTKAKELETPAVARYIGTGDTLKSNNYMVYRFNTCSRSYPRYAFRQNRRLWARFSQCWQLSQDSCWCKSLTFFEA